jgi:hypothetical protein
MQNSYHRHQRENQTTGRFPVNSVTYITPFPLDAILASHLSDQPKSHLLVDCHVRHHSRALEVALPPLSVRCIHHTLHEFLSYAPSLLSRQYCDNVTEIVPMLVSPEFLLCFRLACFPDPISGGTQAAAAQETNIEEALAKPEGPGVEHCGPSCWEGGRNWRRPHCNAKDFVRRRGRRVFCDREKRIAYAPLAAEGKRTNVTLGIELGRDTLRTGTQLVRMVGGIW